MTIIYSSPIAKRFNSFCIVTKVQKIYGPRLKCRSCVTLVPPQEQLQLHATSPQSTVTLAATRWHSSAGTLPSKRLLYSCATFKRAMSPSSVGIVPFSWLSSSHKPRSATSLPTSVGKDIENWLRAIDTFTKRDRSPISEGIAPLN
jgi:hypothetical protein